ncbi:hypothetical protein [Symbioplanes lichenis]|uniref:hypothetical protein n=1 Tax=Symbioplanes lichenis TaxID=1629072 RepID=UPI0027386395|nr:hypothetical protein [Actinoplanes lichenis]
MNLSVLDPSRDREPTEMEWARSRAAVERAIAGGRPAPAPNRRWLTAGAALALGVAAAVVVPAVLPGAGNEAIASWTAVPTARTGDQVLPQARECARNDVGGTSTDSVAPADVLLAEQRGKATLLVLRKPGDITVECLSAGDVGMASMSLTGPGAVPPPAPAGSVTLETMSSYGDGDDMWSNIIGLAGPGVTGVEVRLDNGRVIQASVRNGWWGAWWPGPEGGEVDTFTVVVHAGVRTTTHRPSQLP